MNKWIGIGNLAKDPESGTTQSGIAYCNFTIACQRRYANQQGVREADFFNCKAWRQTAEFVSRYFSKGSKIAVEGTLQNRSYDAQDGSKRWATEIIVDHAEFAGSSQQNGQHGQNSGNGGNYAASTTPPQQQNQQQKMDLTLQGFQEVDDDELPFEPRVSLPTRKGMEVLWSNGVIFQDTNAFIKLLIMAIFALAMAKSHAMLATMFVLGSREF